MNLQRCPYDGTEITTEAYSGGSYLLSCTRCGAAWEAHNSLVYRVAEPDWRAVENARSEEQARRAAAAEEPTAEMDLGEMKIAPTKPVG